MKSMFFFVKIQFTKKTDNQNEKKRRKKIINSPFGVFVDVVGI